MRQMTDDDINNFVSQLVEFLDTNPLLNQSGLVTEEGYDHLRDFVYSRLEGFSNGYINHN